MKQIPRGFGQRDHDAPRGLHGSLATMKKVIPPEVSRAASALGRIGGPKGGRARAAALSPERRTEIAKTAAATRWSKKERLK
jgi:hypothetical protein